MVEETHAVPTKVSINSQISTANPVIRALIQQLKNDAMGIAAMISFELNRNDDPAPLNSLYNMKKITNISMNIDFTNDNARADIEGFVKMDLTVEPEEKPKKSKK